MEISTSHHLSQPESHDDCLLLAEEQKMIDIEEPHHNDVLCGRGVTTNRHPGNESFRSLVGLNKEVYVSSTKRQKMSISRSIVEAVRSLDPPGRFLEKNPETGLWSEIGHKKAVEKTSQALRDGAASLRKQLSADLGDPDFLNAVFDFDQEALLQDSAPRSKSASPKGKGNKFVSDGIENNKSSRKKQSLFVKKAKAVPVKKVHKKVLGSPRRSPSLSKNQRRARPHDASASPSPRYSNGYQQVPASPRSPVPSHATSYPTTPMSWTASRSSYYESENPEPHAPGSPHSHSHYIHQQQPRTPQSSYHQQPYGQSPGYEPESPAYPPQGTRQPMPHPHSWSYSSSRYYAEDPLSPDGNPRDQYSWRSASRRERRGPPPMMPSIPSHLSRPGTPPPRVPKGALPPGRHQYSPNRYSSNPAAPEWPSPRDSQSWHDYSYPSSRNYEGHSHHGHSHPRLRWGSRYSYESHGTPHTVAYPSAGASHSSNSGLSVPSLGNNESAHSASSMSPRVGLAPRSRPGFGEFSSRPPEFFSRPPTYSLQDFVPPPPTTRFRRVPDEESSGARKGYDVTSRISPSGEEKKTDYDARSPDRQISNRLAFPGGPEAQSMPPIKLEPRTTSHFGHIKEEEDEVEMEESDDEEIKAAQAPRSSPVTQRIETVVEGTDAPDHVEDIAMSPIPLDREDPETLMQVPEDILTLPLSACDPTDDPLAASRQ